MTARTPLARIVVTLITMVASSGSHAQIAVENGYVEVRTSTDRGSTAVLLEGLPPASDLKATRVASGTWLRSEKAMGPASAGSAWTGATLGSSFSRGYEDPRVVLASFRARAANESVVSIRVTDLYGRVHCTATGGGRVGAVCSASVPHRSFDQLTSGPRFDLLVQTDYRGSFASQVVVEGFFKETLPTTTELDLEVDPVVSADGTAVVRVPLNLRLRAPGRPVGELITLMDGGTPLRQFVMKSEWDGSLPAASLGIFSDGPNNAAGNPVTASSTHAAITTHRRLPFLVPENVESVEVSASTVEFLEGVRYPNGTPRDLVLELHYLPGDATRAQVSGVPPGRTPEITIDAQQAQAAPAAAQETYTLRAPQLRPGRWFVVPVSKFGGSLDVRVSMEFRGARALKPATGHYFNPARPGHGFHLSEAGNDWVLIWYTYENDGTPVWYYAQAPKPSAESGGSQWGATLYRNVWNGTGTRFQFVGLVQLATTAANRMEFAHLVRGVLGIETMQRLGVSGCSKQIAGQPLDINGLWFSPEKSGYGFSAELIGDSEFYLAYAYDGLGRPVWATAQQQFANADRTPLLQARGFCPTCAASAVTRSEVGQFERTLVARAAPDGLPGFGRLGLDAQWTIGVPGAWRENRSAALLSARTGCR